MKRFARTLAALPVFGFAAQALGAFVIGASILARFGGAQDLSTEGLPSNAAVGGLATMASVVLITFVGFAIRFVAYRLFDSAKLANKVARGTLAALEAAYVVVNLALVFAATDPLTRSTQHWLTVVQLAAVVAVLSLVALGAGGVLKFRQLRQRPVQD